MSTPDEQGGAGRREVAYRLFAAEYEDADLQHSDSDEERAPNYVVTPTGARVNRLFVSGVLTEIETVSEDVLRARVVDPTGAFILYAGQYQPDAKTFLERAEPPEFVAVTGKARTFQPEGSDRVFTSIRPESITAVDASTRDRWTVQAAEHTVNRVATFAGALDREERGNELRDVLLAVGVDYGLAAGIPLSIDHYETTTAYLADVRTLAIQAAEVVTGDRDEVDSLERTPDDDEPVTLEVDAADIAAVDPVHETSSVSPPIERTSASDAVAPESGAVPATGSEREESTDDEADPAVTDALGAGAAPDSTTAVPPNGDESETDELYELDEAEREQVETEFGTEFSPGTEVDEPGEAAIETPTPDEPGGEPDETEGPSVPGAAGGEATTANGDSREINDADAGSDESSAASPDLEAAAVDAMRDLDEGDGAARAAVIEAVVESTGVAPSAVEDAIQDALMSGKCYEPGDDRLKAI